MTILEHKFDVDLKGHDNPATRKALVTWLLNGDEKSYNYYYKEAKEGQVPVVSYLPFRITLLTLSTGNISIRPCLCHSGNSHHIHFKYFS
jgi:hypothetical protein